MVFSSVVFLLYFLPVFLLLYHFTDTKYKNGLILIFSILFYSWGAPKFVFVILASTILDFHIVKNLYKSNLQKTRKWYLAASLFMNLGLLAYFKYANFFVENVNNFLVQLGATEVGWTSVALPIGISFYTFQTLTYSIDVYRRNAVPLTRLTDYLLYIMSFPQMIAGPIVRYNSIANQIVNRPDLVDDKLMGFYRFAIGLAKKVLIANVMAEQADLILDGSYSGLSTANAWLGILAYTFQIYFDFSGYSDMAIGLGRMMGFRFPENFNSPYTAQNISEFWRRWHITLGGFMKDYLYIPLGGNKVSTKSRLYFNLWIVFLLSGLWHGASWNFVIWGAFHGFFLILDRIFLIKLLHKAGKIPSVIFTFFVVVISWTIFRIQDFDMLLIYLKTMFSFHGDIDLQLIPSFNLILVFAVIFSFIVITKPGKRLENFFYLRESYSMRAHFGMITLSIIFFLLSVASITSSGFNPFIYFRF
ncbi:MAG: MBOAT family protein [Bacteroidales bacterium]|nr:MBOAT family protein [Bacteroidales bacterium]